MSDEQSADEREEEPPYDSQKKQKGMFDVYVQWKRGEPHKHEESIRASDLGTALMLAKRNVDVRLGPLSLRVVPRTATKTTKLGDPTVTPGTDRTYRNVQGYPTKEINPPNKEESDKSIEQSQFTES